MCGGTLMHWFFNFHCALLDVISLRKREEVYARALYSKSLEHSMCSALKYWWVSKNTLRPVTFRSAEANGSHKKEGWCLLPFFFFFFQAIAILTVSGGNSLLWSPETSTVKVNWLAIKCMRKSVNKGLINYSSGCLSIFLSLHLSSTSSSKLMHINPTQWSLNTSDLHYSSHYSIWCSECIRCACRKITIIFSKLWSYTFPHTRLHPKKPFFYSSLCSCLIDYLSFFISLHILFFWSWESGWEWVRVRAWFQWLVGLHWC